MQPQITTSWAWLKSNEPERAIKYLEKSLEIDEEIDDRRGQAIDLNLLGNACLKSNEYKKAIKYLEKSLEIDEEIGDRRSQAVDLNLLGRVLEGLGNPREAIQYYEKSLQISRDLKNIKGMSYNLYPLGQIYFDLGNYCKAKLHFKEFVDLPSSKNSWFLLNIFEMLGDIYKYEGGKTEALECYKKAMRLSKGEKMKELGKKIYELRND